MKSLHALLAGAIDYAGLFPPSKLDMLSAVTNYDSYRRSEHAWALGRLIVPVMRLAEFEKAVAKLPNHGAASWRLSAVAGTNLSDDLSSIEDFNDRQEAHSTQVDTIELKASSVSGINEASGAIPPSLRSYVEIPIAENPLSLIEAIGDSRVRAKVRTGGITTDAFPSAANLARFIHECAGARVPFKATAGLHHPLRATYPLTYESNSPSGLMYGFLNVLVAAGVAYVGGDVKDIAAALEEHSMPAFVFNDDGLFWRSYTWDVSTIALLRNEFAISIGSCSFTEPIQDLKSFGTL